jgi:hypothetical protein
MRLYLFTITYQMRVDDKSTLLKDQITTEATNFADVVFYFSFLIESYSDLSFAQVYHWPKHQSANRKTVNCDLCWYAPH